MRVVLKGGRVVFFSRVLDDLTFLRLFFRSFFFGRLGGGVGMNEPEPANFSSCSRVNFERRSASDMTVLVFIGRIVVLLKDCLGRLLVGLPDPLVLPEGVGAKLIVSESSIDSTDSREERGLVIEITSS